MDYFTKAELKLCTSTWRSWKHNTELTHTHTLPHTPTPKTPNQPAEYVQHDSCPAFCALWLPPSSDKKEGKWDRKRIKGPLVIYNFLLILKKKKWSKKNKNARHLGWCIHQCLLHWSLYITELK